MLESPLINELVMEKYGELLTEKTREAAREAAPRSRRGSQATSVSSFGPLKNEKIEDLGWFLDVLLGKFPVFSRCLLGASPIFHSHVVSPLRFNQQPACSAVGRRDGGASVALATEDRHSRLFYTGCVG
jgi:hypothetical protein